MEKLTKEQKAIVRDVNKALEAINAALPSDWTKGQVASVFQAFLEFYK